jgi:hypothetical protein
VQVEQPVIPRAAMEQSLYLIQSHLPEVVAVDISMEVVLEDLAVVPAPETVLL